MQNNNFSIYYFLKPFSLDFFSFLSFPFVFFFFTPKETVKETLNIMGNTVKKKKKEKLNIFTSSKLSKSEISGESILGVKVISLIYLSHGFPKLTHRERKKKKKSKKMWRLSLCPTMRAFNCKRFKQTFIWSCHILLI